MSFSDYLASGGKVLNEGIDPKHAPDGKKTYYRMDNIGKSKYSINFHDGVQTHKDGSKFYDIRIFKNKPSMEAFIRELHDKGYVYGKRPIYEAAGELFVVHGGFLGRPKAALSKAMSREEAESFATDLHGRKHLGLRDISIEPATDKDEVWNSSEAKKYSGHYNKMTKYLINQGRELDEAVTPGTLPGIRAVREYLDLEPGDTSKDEEIRAMSFKEYLGHYLAWEGIIGYTATIAAIADALHDKK